METKEYMNREKASIFTTTLVEAGPVIASGKGARFVDIEGQEFIDFTAQISTLNTGYAPGVVVRNLEYVMKSGLVGNISVDWPSMIYTSGDCGGIKCEVSRAALAEKLIKMTDVIMPFRKRVAFGVFGAEAICTALKIAKITSLRQRGRCSTEWLKKAFLHSNDIFVPSRHGAFRFSFLSLKNAFHGRIGEAQLLTDSRAVQMWGVSSSCAVGKLTLPLACMTDEQILTEVNKKIFQLKNYAPVIGFVFEPIQGEGGINMPDPKKFRILAEYLRDLSVWIIADEIQTGFGRTGPMFGCEHFEIQPDMVVVSKSLAAGMPLSAVIANADKFPDLESGMHSGTMQASVLPVTAAMANLNLLKIWQPYGETMGRYLGRRLAEVTAPYQEFIADVRGTGLMRGVEFREPWQRQSVLNYCRENGLLLAGCGESGTILRITPPLVITEKDINEAVEIFSGALKNLKR